jgi:hypothetical protein
MKKTSFLFLVVFLLVASTGEAALVTRDLVSGSNDRLITLDTQTGLEWLDVNYTSGINSVNYIYDRDPFGAYPNVNFNLLSTFRFATLADIQLLFSNANVGLNLNSLWTSFNTNDFLNAGSLINTLGPTRQGSYTVSGTEGGVPVTNTVYFTEIMGFFVPDPSAPTTTDRIWLQVFREVGSSGTVAIWANNYHDVNVSSLAFVGSPNNAGYFLVRNSAVPIPAAIWLLGSGLVGLIGIRRFRK